MCSTKIATRRADEVSELAKAHEDAGGAIYMATLTIRHKSRDKCADLRKLVATAWKRLQNRRAWRAMKETRGIVGTVRALEVTHGKSGWHPHVHVLLFTKKPVDLDLEMGTQLQWLWLDVVHSLNGSAEMDGQHFRRASAGTVAAEYVAKWGAGHEIAKGAHKDAAGRSVWDLLKASEHDPRAGRLFIEYGEAFKGARHLTYSRGLRELYGLRDAASDQELAESDDQEPLHDAETGEVFDDEQPEMLAYFDHGTWAQIVGQGWTGLILDIAKEDGREGVEAWLSAHGLGSYYQPDDAGGDFSPMYHHPPNKAQRRAFDPASGKSVSEVLK